MDFASINPSLLTMYSSFGCCPWIIAHAPANRANLSLASPRAAYPTLNKSFVVDLFRHAESLV
jgi:hypothetical protein